MERLDEDFIYRDSTFPTGIDSAIEDVDDGGLRLPDVVNFVALRETCLSEAPFVSRTSRKFWKKWMDSSQYITLLCATLKMLLGSINDVGTINAQALYEVQGNPLMEQMSMCIAEMLVMDRKRFSRAHDNLFKRLPELLCYMLVNSLHSCNPRQSRVFNSVKFRELLLDWLSELVGGIRMTNCQSDRRWLFVDTNDTPVNVQNNSFLTTLIPKPGKLTLSSMRTGTLSNSNSNTALSSSGVMQLPPLEETDKSHSGHFRSPSTTPATAISAAGAPGASAAALSYGSRTCNGDTASKGGSTCHFTVGNSPLVSIYMNLGRTASEHSYSCVHPVKLLLTTQPDRPLTSMTPDSLLKASAFREKIIAPEQFHKTLKASAVSRKVILKELDNQRNIMKHEMRRANQTLRIQYALLENKPVDTKKHILATSSSLDNMKFNQSTSSVGTNDLTAP